MVGADHAGYTDRFHELEKLVPHLVTPEAKRVTRYINGLPSQIHGMLRATQPATIQASISILLRIRLMRQSTLVLCAMVAEKRNERVGAVSTESVRKDEKKGKGDEGLYKQFLLEEKMEIFQSALGVRVFMLKKDHA
ncbi:hypothetical protein Tco_0194047 [Tanacetum coccineum]